MATFRDLELRLNVTEFWKQKLIIILFNYYIHNCASVCVATAVLISATFQTIGLSVQKVLL